MKMSSWRSPAWSFKTEAPLRLEFHLRPRLSSKLPWSTWKRKCYNLNCCHQTCLSRKWLILISSLKQTNKKTLGLCSWKCVLWVRMQRRRTYPLSLMCFFPCPVFANPCHANIARVWGKILMFSPNISHFIYPSASYLLGSNNWILLFYHGGELILPRVVDIECDSCACKGTCNLLSMICWINWQCGEKTQGGRGEAG